MGFTALPRERCAVCALAGFCSVLMLRSSKASIMRVWHLPSCFLWHLTMCNWLLQMRYLCVAIADLAQLLDCI